MNHEDFVTEYNEIVDRALCFAKKARQEGLFALEGIIDEHTYNQRDIFEFGMRLVIDGTDGTIINKILTNIVNLETDDDKRVLQTIKKEAVLEIQMGSNPRLLKLLLNSYVTIGIEEAMKEYKEV